MRSRLVSVVAAALVGAGIAMVALPSVESSAGTSPCGLSVPKCVGIVSPFPNQTLVAGVSGQTISYTLQVDPGAPGSGLGSGSIQPTAGSGITFTAVTSSVAGASCFISSAGAATCLSLGQRAGRVFTITVKVNVACDAGADTFSTLWSGASDFRNNPNGRADQYLLDTASTPYLQETVTGGCSLAFVSEPATTTVGTGIPSLVGTSAASNPVQVKLLNGNGLPVAGLPVTVSLTGGPVGAVLAGGATETTDASGVASFPSGASAPLSINEVGTYQLVASSPGYPPATSGTRPSDPGVGGFDIAGALVSCATATICTTSGSAPDGTSYAVHYANNSGQTEILTSGIGLGTYDCGTYTPTSDALTTAVYFAASGLQDASAVTTNDVQDPAATWSSADRTCFQSTTQIPESSVAPGYGCDPNAAGPCQGTFDGQPQYSAVLNTCSSDPSGTVTVGSQPRNVAVVAPFDAVYVSNSGDNTVSAIDASTNTLIANVAVGGLPLGLAFDPANDEVYVAVEGSPGLVVAIDVSPTSVNYNQVVARITLTGNQPQRVAVDAATNTVYASVLDTGSVVVIDGATNTVSDSVLVGGSPFGVAVDAATDRIYVAGSPADDVSVIDGSNDTVTATIPVGAGSGPFEIDVSPVTDTVYVGLRSQQAVAVIDASTNTVTTTIALAGIPDAVAVDATTDNVYVVLSGANDLAVIDGTTNATAGTIAVGNFPIGAAVDPSTAMAYVSNDADNTVSAVRLVGAPCENFNRPLLLPSTGAEFDWQSVGDPTGRDA